MLVHCSTDIAALESIVRVCCTVLFTTGARAWAAAKRYRGALELQLTLEFCGAQASTGKLCFGCGIFWRTGRNNGLLDVQSVGTQSRCRCNVGGERTNTTTRQR